MSYNRKREDRVKSNNKYARDTPKRTPYSRTSRDASKWKPTDELC